MEVRFAVVVFVLPDGAVVLQRRTDDAPYAPGMLGVFGGAIEGDESPGDGVRREIGEETSLDVGALQLTACGTVVLPPDGDRAAKRTFYVFACPLAGPDFEVFEGVAAEVHTLEGLWTRDDVTGSVLPAVEAAIALHQRTPLASGR